MRWMMTTGIIIRSKGIFVFSYSARPKRSILLILTSKIFMKTKNSRKLYLWYSLLPQNYSCPSCYCITLLDCQCHFWPCVAIAIAAFLKRDCNYRTNCETTLRLHDANLKPSLMKEKKQMFTSSYSHFYVLAFHI